MVTMNHDHHLKLGEDFRVVTVNDLPENCIHFSKSVVSEGKEEYLTEVEIDHDDAVRCRSCRGLQGCRRGWF